MHSKAFPASSVSISPLPLPHCPAVEQKGQKGGEHEKEIHRRRLLHLSIADDLQIDIGCQGVISASDDSGRTEVGERAEKAQPEGSEKRRRKQGEEQGPENGHTSRPEISRGIHPLSIQTLQIIQKEEGIE